MIDDGGGRPAIDPGAAVLGAQRPGRDFEDLGNLERLGQVAGHAEVGCFDRTVFRREAGDHHDWKLSVELAGCADHRQAVQTRHLQVSNQEAIPAHAHAVERVETVGGYVLARLGRVPRVGETLNIDDVHVEVLEGERRRVKRVRMRRRSAAASG